MGFGSHTLVLLRKACKLTFAILLFPISIYSQQYTDLENYVLVKRLSSDDGLSQGNITAILRDSNGFTWIGTDNGLSRFDGDEIHDFKYNFGDSTSISDNRILCLFEDSQQRLWVGTSRGGLNLFDKISETFISLGKNNNHPFNRYSVFDIMEDKEHNIWVATQNGLYKSNTSPYSFTLIPQTVEDMDGRITSILEDNDNNIWMGTLHGLSVMSKKDYSITTYYSNPKKENTLTSDRINTIFLDNEKKLWIGTGNGLSILNTRDRTIFNFNTDPNDLKSIDSKIIYTINEDAKGRIWLGTKGAGIAVYKKEGLNNFSLAPVSPSLANLNTPIQAIYFDKDGLIWVGTYGDGVKVWGRKTKDFDYIKLKDAPLSDVLCMAEDHENLIWIGSAKGLLTYQPKTNSIQLFSQNNHQTSALNTSVIKSLLVDRDNNIFAGTYSHGLIYIDNKTKKTITYANSNKPESIPSNDVWSLCQDSKKRIWIGTLGAGVCEFNSTNQSFTRYPVMDGDKISTRSNSISKVYEDSKGNIWLGTIGQGVSKLNEKEKVFKVCSSPENISTKISSNEVIDIFESDGGTLYVTTKEEGLFYYDSKTEKFIPEHNDNLQRALLSILEDNQGNLWMGTFYGLCKYNPQNKSAMYYTTVDGLQGNEFRSSSKLKSSSGRFYFGSTNGITTFLPENIKTDSIVPSVILTDFYIFHEKLAKENSVMNGHIRFQNNLTLQADQNTFTIQFSAQSYKFPKKNQYAYKLENFDSEWNKIGMKRSATYTNLPPGEYIFKVKASNNDGVWGTETTDIHISIRPPFWKTWWFRILVILFSVGAVLSVFRYRVYQLKQDNLILEEKVRQRTGELSGLVTELQRKQAELSIALNKMNTQKTHIEQINQELKTTHEELKTINDELDQKVFERTLKLQKANHELDRFVYSASHDLSAPLKSLLGLIQITRIEKRADQIDGHLDKMELTVTKLERVIESLTQLSRNMGHQVKKEALNFSEIVEEVLNDINHLPGFNNVKIIKNFNDNDTITSDYFRTKIILINLLSNAIKYKSERADSFILINFSVENNRVLIEIKDNGIGIDRSSYDKIFDMFYRGTTQSNGSGLGLYIVKETVEKLNGEIKVESKPGESTTFSISLPN